MVAFHLVIPDHLRRNPLQTKYDKMNSIKRIDERVAQMHFHNRLGCLNNTPRIYATSTCLDCRVILMLCSHTH